MLDVRNVRIIGAGAAGSTVLSSVEQRLGQAGGRPCKSNALNSRAGPARRRR